MSRTLRASLIAIAVAATDLGRAGADSSLQNGTYNCIAGFSVMLTLGKMQIDGNNFRFNPESGASTTGHFIMAPDGKIRWTGDFGAIRNAQIAESGREGNRTDSFWFKYRVPPNAWTTTASCGRI